MSMKLSIRPRNLDACKYIPIYKCEEIPDLNDYASINRSIPQLPTGMEKEEESEHHLQKAISAQQSKGTGELVSIVIPTPEVYSAPDNFYNNLYPQNFKLPRQLIHVQPFAFEHDIPDYDRDSEDEMWLESQKDIPNLTPLKFEELIDCFDKSSSQHVISLKEAKTLIKEDEDLIIAVYDYWLNKRLRLQTPLIPVVKTERRDQSTNNSNNPYIAFRRRTEKMQTRKNRKNDEISYEKMIKLKRDLSRALNLTQLVKQREEVKKELVRIRVDIFEKRYLLGDYNGNIINEISAQRQQQIRQQQSNYLQANMKANENKPPRVKDDQQPRKKREYRKRRPEIQQRAEQELNEFAFTSDDEDLNDNLSHSVSDQDEDDSDGPYTFKRKKGCQYYAPLPDPFDWSCFETLEERASNKIKYCLTEIRHNNKRQFEYVRRRIGRGGRIILDRTHLKPNFLDEEDDNTFDYFRPRSSAFRNQTSLEESMEVDEQSNDDNLIYIRNVNLNSSINFNDYLNEKNDLYTNYNKNTDADLTKFKNHQKELNEMLKQRKEKLNNTDKYEDELNNDKILSNKEENEKDLDSLNKCNNNQSLSSSQFINHNSSSSITKNLNLNSVTPNSTIKTIVNNNSNSSSLNVNTTSVPQQKSLSTLDSKSINFAVSAVLSTVNNSIDNSSISSINTSSSIQTTNTINTTLNNNTNGPLQLNSNLNDNINLIEYDKSTSNNQYSPSQLNNLNSNSIALSNQPQFINTQSSPILNNQTTTAHQLLTQQPQWSNQQQTNELTNSSSNVYKLKFQNNQNSIKSEPKLTPTDVT